MNDMVRGLAADRSDGLDMSGACLDRIESAMAQGSSRLAQALVALESHCDGRGTCLLLEHDELGETLIADRAWAHGRDETLRNREHFAVVDLRQEFGFRRMAVLVEPTGNESSFDARGYSLAMAALDVTEALADIAAPFFARKEIRESGAKEISHRVA